MIPTWKQRALMVLMPILGLIVWGLMLWGNGVFDVIASWGKP